MKLQTAKKRGVKKFKTLKKQKNVKLSTLSVQDFMSSNFSCSDSDSSMEGSLPKRKLKAAKRKTDTGVSKNKVKTFEEEKTEGSLSDSCNDESEDGADEANLKSGDKTVNELVNHKKSLHKLRKTDPEFYKFLEENDKKLLQFNLSDSDSDADDNEEDMFHKPAEDLEVGSDDSDFETTDEIAPERGVITLKMVKHWQQQLQCDKTSATINSVIQAFHAALKRVSNEDDDTPTRYKVESSIVFNAVIQLCVLELQPAVKRFLKLPNTGKVIPHKCKKWVKVKTLMKSYLTDIIKLLSGVSSENILLVLLKHLHQLMPFVASFPNITKPLLKKLVSLWSSGEETIRVVAFLCLLKLTVSEQKSLLDKVLKMMYLAFMRNSKFVSPNTLPGINFMRRSLTEMYALDEGTSYHHVFLYIRQLAIHLRNAITLQKKEHRQAVCNWQFIESLHLWSDLLSVCVNKTQLQSLIYPLVQVIVGTIKLVPTAQYYPLRFHCLQFLTDLSKNSGVFIPVLPFINEILNTFDFNKRHKTVSMKPLDFTCILRLSKSQLQENGFKDTVIEKIYQQLLEYTSNESHSIGFPDLTIASILQLKRFLKTCKNPNYCKKMRQILEKIEENSKYVENERKKVAFSLSDKKSIDAWETNLTLKGTPLMNYYLSWKKVHAQQMAKKITNNEKIGDFSIPVLKKHAKKSITEEENEGPVELFPSDSDDDDLLLKSEDNSGEKTKRGKRGSKQNSLKKKEIKFEDDDDEEKADIIEEFRLSDME